MMQAVMLVSMTLNNIQIYQPPAPGVFGTSGTPRPFLSTESQAFNGISLWRNALPDSQVWNLPAYYQDTFRTRTPADYTLPKDSQVVYECPAGGTGPCDIVVFLYECYPCKSLKGGLPKYLLKDMMYQRSRCAPTFTVKKGGAQHRMTAFVKTVPRGHVETLHMPGDVQFVFFGMSASGEGRDCGKLGEVQCRNTNDKCVYNRVAEQCKVTSCIQKGPGGCNPNSCVYKELNL